jgi:S1-C subfamily serine protease
MRILYLFLSGLLPLILTYPSWASEDDLRQRILNHLRVATSLAEIHEPQSEIATPRTYGPDLYRSLVGEELYPRLVNAVVYIVTEEGVTGAGTVISSSFGLIVTNWHVIGNEKVVGLVFKPKGLNRPLSFEKDDIFFARILTTDSIRDLALLEIVSRPGKMIAAPLGSTSNLGAGHEVFSVSHPRGSPWSYSEGTISQMTPRHEWVRGLGIVHRASTIQTETVSNNGSSGNPLFNEEGQFIGVLVGENGSEPNFAISIDEIREFVFSFLR